MKLLWLIVLLGPLTLVNAQVPDETVGLRNGRFWNAMGNQALRVTFLFGILQGWELRAQTEETASGAVINAMSKSKNGSFTVDDLGAMVTEVYTHSENLNLPVGWVAMACLAVQRGETTNEASLAALRRFLRDLPQHAAADPAFSPVFAIVASGRESAKPNQR